MRLRKTGEKYEFDLWFYALAFCLVMAIGVAFWQGQKLLAQSSGRKIQALITQTKLDSPEHYQKMAKTWMDGPARYHKLVPAERKQAEAIVAEGMKERHEMWQRMLMEATKPEEVRSRQKAHWQGVMSKLNTYLRSIGKNA